MFITLEGIEGAGKTTLIKHLAEELLSLSQEVVITREPGGCELGVLLRTVLLDPKTELCPEAELFLFLADRAQHVADVIRPALLRGAVVLCDRYIDSTIVYQGYGRNFDVEELLTLNRRAVGGLWPDHTFILDTDPEVALLRARTRNAALGMANREDRFEAETIEFHTRLRDGFLDWAKRNPGRISLLDAAQTPEQLTNEVIRLLSAREMAF